MGPPRISTLPLSRYPLHHITQYSGSEDSQRAICHSTGFLDLPPEVRCAIYELVLTMRHPIYLFEGCQGRVEYFPVKPKWWLALLHVNRQTHMEAKAVLYAKNYFCLMDNPRRQDDILQAFVNCIGPTNTTLISRICVGFPITEKARDRSDGVRIREDSVLSLRLLSEKFINVETLELRVSSDNSACLTETGEDGLKRAREAMVQIDAQLASISSVKKIVVRVYNKSLTHLIMDQMQELRWVVLSR